METMTEAISRLRRDGFALDFTATDDGRLRCGACGANHEPSAMVIDEIVRYEGSSNPDDEAILLAMHCACQQAGLYLAAFGPNATAADAAVLQLLP